MRSNVKSKIDLVVLDVNQDNEKYDFFWQKNAKEKVDQFCYLIEESIKNLDTKNPESMKIFVWREYAIANEYSLFSSNELKGYLKKRMSDLTSRYPSLCIISGTVAVKRHFDDFNVEYHGKIKKDYDENVLLNKLLSKEKDDDISSGLNQITLHLNKLDEASKSNHSGVDIIRNSCFIFQGEKLQRRDKCVPFFETKERDHPVNDKYYDVPDNVVFRPGKGQKKLPVLNLTHPDTGENIPISIEICAEHASGLLKHEKDMKQIPEKPVIGFILSDSIGLNLNHVYSDYVIQADSSFKTRLVKTNKSNDHKYDIELYQINLLDENPVLKGPLRELYPIEIEINELLTNTMAKLNKIPKCPFKSEFQTILASYSDLTSIDSYLVESSIKAINALIIKHKAMFNFLDSPEVQELRETVKNLKTFHNKLISLDGKKEYRSIEDAQPKNDKVFAQTPNRSVNY